MKPISQRNRGMCLEELTYPGSRISVYLFFLPLSVVDKKRSLNFSRISLAFLNQRGTCKETLPEYVPAKLHSYN